MNRRKFLAAVGSILALGGCSSATPKPKPCTKCKLVSWNKREDLFTGELQTSCVIDSNGADFDEFRQFALQFNPILPDGFKRSEASFSLDAAGQRMKMFWRDERYRIVFPHGDHG